MNVLIAEDDPITRRMVEVLLQRLGHDVAIASNGAEAWAHLTSTYVPLVISDWIMPDVSGLELCRRIRQRPADARYTYVILLTAMEGREHFLEAMASGVDDFLTKPPDFDQITARVRVAERILGLESHVKRLEGLLPICSYCKKIRDERQAWQPIEQYLSEQTESRLSHGICPECYERVMNELGAP